MDPTSGALALAATVAVGAYVNGKLAIGTDIQQLQNDRAFGERLGGRIQTLGDKCTLYHMFEMVDPAVEFLWFEGKTWTYGDIRNEVNKLSAFLEAEGASKGDHIAVFSTNSPEMVIIVLALSKLGVVAGLININLRDETLKHCLKISTAQTVISTPDLSGFIPESVRHFSLNLSSFSATPKPQTPAVTFLELGGLPLPTTVRPAAKASLRDVALLIYTSGTTGKPKACAVRNSLILLTSTPTSVDFNNPKKYYPLRTYSPLPLFHGTAMFTAICYNIGNSSTVCLARKFSTSRFWKDVTDSRATRILYVGELCRYLVHGAPTPFDRGHNCIVAAGNGLRGEIWEKFKERFGIPEIREFYRSTEGTAKYDNVGRGSWGAGRVGFEGPLRRYLEKDTIIVKMNPETETPYRDPKTGFCVRAKLGEVGEALGRVKDRNLLTEYLNNAPATEEKLMFDVFDKGDCFQRAGDLLFKDHDGWVHFYDRMGDTFRWKGENVSAGEVRDHLAKLPEVIDAVVYGVKLASYDGQAGAAALTLDSASDGPFMDTLHLRLKNTGLPSYAMPRLVRITPEIEVNATFKKAKGDIMKKSWSSDGKDKDKLYWLNGTAYKKLDVDGWSSIETGKAKL